MRVTKSTHYIVPISNKAYEPRLNKVNLPVYSNSHSIRSNIMQTLISLITNDITIIIL